MKVRVQFYAQLRDLIGAREMDVQLAEGATVGDLLEKIYAQQPALRLHDKSILIGAGGSHAFVDPENKIAFAYVMNQMEQSLLPNEKSLRLIDAIYRCA